MDKEIAKTILIQLGGSHFTTMVGAKNIYSIDAGLQLDFMRNPSKANRLRVILNGDDTYTMQFYKKGRNPSLKLMAKSNWQELCQPKLLKEYKGVYCDTIRCIFEDYTKLRTSLTHIYGTL